MNVQHKQDGAEDTALRHIGVHDDSEGCGGAHPDVLRPVYEEVLNPQS